MRSNLSFHRDAYLMNWLANLRGKLLGFKEMDLLQEHQNFWLKVRCGLCSTLNLIPLTDYLRFKGLQSQLGMARNDIRVNLRTS
jgi:hypothetical protein